MESDPLRYTWKHIKEFGMNDQRAFTLINQMIGMLKSKRDTRQDKLLDELSEWTLKFVKK